MSSDLSIGWAMKWLSFISFHLAVLSSSPLEHSLLRQSLNFWGSCWMLREIWSEGTWSLLNLPVLCTSNIWDTKYWIASDSGEVSYKDEPPLPIPLRGVKVRRFFPSSECWSMTKAPWLGTMPKSGCKNTPHPSRLAWWTNWGWATTHSVLIGMRRNPYSRTVGPPAQWREP